MTAFGRGPLSLSANRSSSVLTYEPYYGLSEKPFSLSPDPRFLYRSPSHAVTFDDLLLGIRRREGLIVLTGDIGTGKTTLCRAVLDQLDRKTFSTFVPDPFVSREDLLKMLLIDFGVMSVDDLKSGRLNSASRPDLSYPLYEFLKSLLPLQAFAVLVIDEAQNLSLPLLEEIRILSDLEAPEKLLQVVLVGQLEFRAKLKLPEMRQVDHRVSIRCSLEPLPRDGVAGYIAHRLQVAGGGSDRIEFSPDAVTMVSMVSGGVPRLINLICDRALHRGHLARVARIEDDIVALAVADLEVGDLTPTPLAGLARSQRTGTAAGFASGHDLPRTRTESINLGLGELQVDLDVGIHEPAREVPTEATQIAASGKNDTSSKAARTIALRLGDGMSANRWRRRTRRFAHVAIAIGAIGLVAVLAEAGLMYFYPQLGEEQPQIPAPAGPSMRLPEVPLPPAVPLHDAQEPPAAAAPAPGTGEKPYTIDVAMFQSAQRARRLVEQLAVADYPAYQVEMDLGVRGRAYVVMVGAYAAPADAEPDLARIRQIPGHADARIMAAPPRSLSQ